MSHLQFNPSCCRFWAFDFVTYFSVAWYDDGSVCNIIYVFLPWITWLKLTSQAARVREQCNSSVGDDGDDCSGSDYCTIVVIIIIVIVVVVVEISITIIRIIYSEHCLSLYICTSTDRVCMNRRMNRDVRSLRSSHKKGTQQKQQQQKQLVCTVGAGWVEGYLIQVKCVLSMHNELTVYCIGLCQIQ